MRRPSPPPSALARAGRGECRGEEEPTKPDRGDDERDGSDACDDADDVYQRAFRETNRGRCHRATKKTTARITPSASTAPMTTQKAIAAAVEVRDGNGSVKLPAQCGHRVAPTSTVFRQRGQRGSAARFLEIRNATNATNRARPLRLTPSTIHPRLKLSLSFT